HHPRPRVVRPRPEFEEQTSMSSFAVRAVGAKASLPGIITLGLALAAAVAAPRPAAAGLVTPGQSDSFGVPSNLTLTLLSAAQVQANVAPQPVAQGNAPAAYNAHNQLAALNVNAGVFGVLNTSSVLGASTGLIDSTANSTVDGLPGARSADATNVI